MAALGAKDRDRIDMTLNIIRWMIRAFLEPLDVPELSLPVFDPASSRDPENAAESLRSFWELPRGPIGNLTKTIEKAGIIVFPFEFGTTHLDALTILSNDTPPIIFVAKSIPADRYRFTLAHELGHLYMHRRMPTPMMEIEADRFAGTFLIPTADARVELSQLNFTKLGILKLRWKVSMAALIMRAKQSGAISEKWAVYLMTELSRRGYRKREPIDIPPESAWCISKVLHSLQDGLHQPLSTLTAQMGVPEEDFRQWFPVRESARVFSL